RRGYSGRTASMAIQSPSALRSVTTRSTAANALRTSASRSTKIPEARSTPPGRSSAWSGSARAIRTDAIRFARTTSCASSPLGRLPARATIRSASPFRAAFAIVASIAIGSVSTPRTDAAPSRAAAIARIPEPQPTSRTRAAPSRPRSATSSSAARHSRVVGRRPVPKAIPGSRSRTTSPGAGSWASQVGRMTSRRPIRITGKWAFQASAQSASWTTRVVSSPIGRSPNAWRWPSASAASPAARSAAPGSRAGTYARTIDGRVGSIRAPRPSSTSSKAGSTLVPPGANRPRISDTASTASTSTSTESSSHIPAELAPSALGCRSLTEVRGRAPRGRRPEVSAKRVADLVEDSVLGRHGFAGVRRILREQLALTLRQLGRDDDVHEDVEISLGAGPAEVRHASPAQPDLGAGLRSGLDLDLLVAVDRRHRDRRPEGRLGDRDVGLVEQLGALAPEVRVGRDVNGDVQRARRTAAHADLALVREPDLVALVDPGRDRDAEGPLPLRPSLAVARLAGLADELALAVAFRAGRDVDHLAEHRPARRADLAAPAAVVARDRLGARLGAVSPAGLAPAVDGELDLLLGPADRFLERD